MKKYILYEKENGAIIYHFDESSQITAEKIDGYKYINWTNMGVGTGDIVGTEKNTSEVRDFEATTIKAVVAEKESTSTLGRAIIEVMNNRLSAENKITADELKQACDTVLSAK